MMLSSTGASLRMRADIVRRTSGDDPFGGSQTWTPVAEDVRCLWWSRSGREQIDDVRSVVVADEHLLLDRDQDVEAGDRIVNLVDQFGREIFGTGGFREVEHVQVGRQHLDCSLRVST